ncbi:MAG TPA: IMP dehydrogenase [Candidatus Acidoferrales bacterium]|nr:IMP dehydrogenase [Candidatus Acidoferrales bacterium]
MKTEEAPRSKFASKFKDIQLALTFRDVVILPGRAEVEPSQVDVHTHVTKRHKLNIPFISSPMDTVTESEMAIALARQGGLGVVHRNCSIEEQVDMVKRIKRAEALIIRDVITVTPDDTVGQALTLMEKHNISGLPVVEGSKLVGIVTGRDVRFAQPTLTVSQVMTKEIVKAEEGTSLEDAQRLLRDHKIEKLPIVSKSGELAGLITFKDILLRGKYPDAARDENGHLLCAAAVSPFDLERARKLDEFADILVTDVSHFHNANVFKATKKLMSEVSAAVIVGNIGTYQAAEDAIAELEMVAGFRVGIGSGSICTTAEVTKAGSPTLFATAQVSDAVTKYGANIPIIADGGIRTPGDAAIALTAGASAVMAGNLFARCRESPGTLITIGGRYYKQYRGMGSPTARAKRYSLDRYSMPSKGVPEGVEGWVPYKGEVNIVLDELVSGLRASMGYAGAKNIEELWRKATFAALSPSGAEEAGPHDILLPTEAQERV